MFTAHDQYNHYARFAEFFYPQLIAQATKNGYPPEQIETQRATWNSVRESPLYLFQPDKCKKSEDYSDLNPLFDLTLCCQAPCLVATSEETVHIISLLRTGEPGHFRVFAEVSHIVEADNHNIFVVGQMVCDLFGFEKRPKLGSTALYSLTWQFFNTNTKPWTRAAYGDKDKLDDVARQDFSARLVAAFRHLWYTMKPGNVVFKEQSKKAKKKGLVPGIVPRADQREKHILLDPDEVTIIKTKAAAHEGKGPARKPHHRRSHARTFRADRYKNMKGKTIFIDGFDVGVKPGETLTTPRYIYHVVSIGGQGAEV